MTSRIYGSNLVIENQQEKNGSSHRQHRSHADTNFSTPYSGSKSKSRGVKESATLPRQEKSSKHYSTLPGDEDTSKQYSSLPRGQVKSKEYSTLPRDEDTSRQYRTLPRNETSSIRYSSTPGEETTSKRQVDTISDHSSHKSRASAHNNEYFPRRSSRHHDNDIPDRNNDAHRRRSSRHYEGDITDRANDLSQRRSTRHNDNDVATARGNEISQTRSSRHYSSDATDRTNDTSHRRSSRHYENDNGDRSNDLSRRRSSRHHENEEPERVKNSARSNNRYHTDLPTDVNLSSSRHQGRPDGSRSRVYDRGSGEINQNYSGVESRGQTKSFSEHRAVNGFNGYDRESRHLPHKDSEDPRLHSNGNKGISSFREHGTTEGEYPDRKSRSKGRDNSRERYRGIQDMSRSSSQILAENSDILLGAHNHSHQSSKAIKEVTRNNRARDKDNNRMDRSPSRRSHGLDNSSRQLSPLDYGPSDDQKENTFSTTRRENSERHKTHKPRESSEVRERCTNNNTDHGTRRRNSSITRGEEDRHGANRETGHGKSHSAYRSSSKQSLVNDEIESAYSSSAEAKNVHNSKSRLRSEQRNNSAAQKSHRRSSITSQNDEARNNIIRQSSTSASDISKDASHPGSNDERKRQRRPTSDERQGKDSSITVHRTREVHEHADKGSRHISAHPVIETVVRPRGSSTSRRISATADDEQEVVNVSLHKQDSSHSRRSSSSRSNHDTGFASSSSSPRRDDSQSRFHSNISPSPYVEEDCPKSRADESRRRRRSKMMTNNSLDVPGAPLRKEQSLSSSGRGDSSFDEPYTDGATVKSSKKITDDHNKEASHGALEGATVSTSRLFKHERRDNPRLDSKMPAVNIKDNLIVSQTIGRSSQSIGKENESPKLSSKGDMSEVSSSTSTLRESNITTKASLSESISSLLGRGNKYQQFRSNQPETTTPPISISDKWRKLREGIIPDRDLMSDTLKEKTAAVTIFYAAAARFMSSLPGVQNTFSRRMQSPFASSANVNSTCDITLKENGHSLTKLEDNVASKSGSDIVVAPTDNSSVLAKADKTISSHSIQSMEGPNGLTSHRPSVISTTGTLSSLNKRISAYALMTEKRDTPGSDSSGLLTPSLDAEMQRKSKELDSELTSFLPAEMSRREEKFHDAARVNDTAAIRSLLKERVNINCRNSLDRTALHWAVANGNQDAAEVLIESGADLEAKDKYGMRAVLWAAWFGHVSVLKVLINAGANTRVTNKQGLGILHCASENNHVSVISFIFDALEHYDVNQRDKNDRTSLHSAAEGGHVEAVNRLLEAKADLHKKDKSGRTAVHSAARSGHIEVLKALLLQGVEVDDRDVDGKTALHLAAEAGHKETVDLLLDYTANPNSETVKEVTPLHLAAQEGHVEVCRSLVKYGLNVNARNFQGNSALHIAANGNHKEVARILIDAKCELDLPNNRMQTPLHVAVESGHLDVVQILLAGGASLDTREKSGKSALQLAARGNYAAVVDMLIKAERYYANAREYHDKDVGYVDPDTYLRNPQHPHAAQMKDTLWKLATKQLKPTDWKKLAYHWRFTPEHVKAIEQEYTGTASYKEHSYRLLNIWLHGVRKDENLLKLLFEALVAIEKKQLAESVRRQVNLQAEKPCSPSLCSVS